MNEETEPARRVGLVQDIDARQVREGADLVATVLVPQMRARLTRDLASKGLRPLDGWPPVQVHRFVWTTAAGYAAAMNGNGSPPGMREARDGETPDLYRLALVTDAVPDTQQVIL